MRKAKQNIENIRTGLFETNKITNGEEPLEKICKNVFGGDWAKLISKNQDLWKMRWEVEKYNKDLISEVNKNKKNGKVTQIPKEFFVIPPLCKASIIMLRQNGFSVHEDEKNVYVK